MFNKPLEVIILSINSNGKNITKQNTEMLLKVSNFNYFYYFFSK